MVNGICTPLFLCKLSARQCLYQEGGLVCIFSHILNIIRIVLDAAGSVLCPVAGCRKHCNEISGFINLGRFLTNRGMLTVLEGLQSVKLVLGIFCEVEKDVLFVDHILSSLVVWPSNNSRIMSLKNSNDTIVNWTRVLPVCSVVP
jgi:hypothetical protein